MTLGFLKGYLETATIINDVRETISLLLRVEIVCSIARYLKNLVFRQNVRLNVRSFFDIKSDRKTLKHQ